MTPKVRTLTFKQLLIQLGFHDIYLKYVSSDFLDAKRISFIRFIIPCHFIIYVTGNRLYIIQKIYLFYCASQLGYVEFPDIYSKR